VTRGNAPKTADFVFAQPRGALLLVSKADGAGFYTVATEAGPSVVVRGWSGERRFVAQWIDGKAARCYWWTRQHEAVASFPTETVRWESQQPLPVAVNVTRLKQLLLLPQE
jgi:hypothetical protein